MSLTDPVADFLTRVRNAINARHQKVDVPLFQAEAGDCPHPEGRGLHRELQGDGRRRPQGAARVPEVRPDNSVADFAAEAHFASRVAVCTSATARFRACWVDWVSTS